jgi:hypothetical protein
MLLILIAIGLLVETVHSVCGVSTPYLLVSTNTCYSGWLLYVIDSMSMESTTIILRQSVR